MSLPEERVAPSPLRALLLPVYLPALLLAVGSGALNTFLPLYLMELGASVAVAATLVGVGTAGILIFDLPSGLITARFGERRVLVVSGAAMAGAAALIGVSRSLVTATLGMFLANAAASFWLLGRLAFMRSALRTSVRGRGLALLGGIMRIGLFIGPVAGGFLAKTMGYRGVFLGNAALAVTALVLFLVSKDARDGTVVGTAAEISLRAMVQTFVAKRRVFATAGLSMLVLAMVRSARGLVFPLWGQAIGLDTAAIGLAVGLSSAADSLTFYPAGILSDRLGRKWSAVSCLLAVSAGLALVPLTHTWAPFVVVGVLVGLGNGLGSGINMTLGADFAAGVEPSLFLGLWRLVTDVGAAAAPLLIGLIAATVALGPAALVIAGVGLAGAGFHAVAVEETLETRRQPRPGQRLHHR